jgi:hypothetical protein
MLHRDGYSVSWVQKQISPCQEHPDCAVMVVSGSPSGSGSYAAEGAWHFTAKIDLVPQWTIFGPEGQRAEALVLK